MKILAIDTTQSMCSSALMVEEECRYREEDAPRDHTRLLLPQVESLLAEAQLKLTDLDVLAFGRGPGSFTGLRIAAGVIQGLALGADLPVAPVSSLAVLAQGARRDHPDTVCVCAAFDARIEEVYWGCYALNDGLMQPVTDEAVSAPQSVNIPDGNNWVAVGSGWSAYPLMAEHLSGRLVTVMPDRVPVARDILPFAKQRVEQKQLVSADQALPVYLRHKVAQTVKERQQ